MLAVGWFNQLVAGERVLADETPSARVLCAKTISQLVAEQ